MRNSRLQRSSGLSSVLFVTLSVLILFASSTVFAQAADVSSTALALAYKVQEAWVARYNGPDNAMDTGNAVAVDEQGNVYVAGGTGNLGPGSGTNDYAILKYDPSGNLLWVQRYNGPGSGPYLNDDGASALAVDEQGNVYVTGSSRGNDTTYDYATLKYDTNGNLLWVQRYSTPDTYDNANALAVDGQGNVYVTGSTATLKYDTNGKLLWAQRYNDGSSGYSSAIALAMDEQGNVYVTGSGPSVYTAGSGDYITLKYDTNGTLLWTQHYSGLGFWANANDIAVDRRGNAYVTGTICTAISVNGCVNVDYATLKYDPQGNLQWEQRYNGPDNNSDWARALTVDKQGDVYVTGYSWGSGTGSDYATLKYDTNGKLLWAQRYNGLGNDWDEPHALALDKHGNVYVTGISTVSGTAVSGANIDYTTLKYNRHGNLLWAQRYNGPGTSSDFANALTVDEQGNVYVTGYSWGSGSGLDVDAVTIKYSQ